MTPTLPVDVDPTEARHHHVRTAETAFAALGTAGRRARRVTLDLLFIALEPLHLDRVGLDAPGDELLVH